MTPLMGHGARGDSTGDRRRRPHETGASLHEAGASPHEAASTRSRDAERLASAPDARLPSGHRGEQRGAGGRMRAGRNRPGRRGSCDLRPPGNPPLGGRASRRPV